MQRTPYSGPWRSRISLLVLAASGQLAYAEGNAPPRSIPDFVEEEVAGHVSPGNGAGPLWCYGASLVVRRGDDVWVSVAETGEGVPPLSNTRWRLLHREAAAAGDAGAWTLVAQPEGFREREPCPIAALSGTLFISSNASTAPPGTWYGPTQPAVFALDSLPGAPASSALRVEAPAWRGEPAFTDHSYRGFAADAEQGELLLLHIDAKTSEQHVSWRDAGGRWQARGSIAFAIRGAYPQVALRRGAAHVLAIGDIVEPREEWRTLKKEKTGRDWDYVFRRLFYTWTPSIRERPFAAPLEVATTEETCGHIANLDLHVDERGRARVLWLERPHVHDFIRDRYFAGARFTAHLRQAVLEEGRVVERDTLLETPAEGQAGFEPGYARFHLAPDGGVHLIASGAWIEASGAREAGMGWGRVSASPGASLVLERLALERPFGTFFTSAPRGGSTPSWTVDLFGSTGGTTLRYASFRLPQPIQPTATAGSPQAPWSVGSLEPAWAGAQPLRTIQLRHDAGKSDEENGVALAAALARLQAGDRLEIEPGRYSVERRLDLDVAGTAEAPVWIVAADSERAPVVTRPDARQNVVNVGGGSPTRFLCLRGLELTGGSTLIRFHDCQDVWLDRCHLHHAGHEGITTNTRDTSRFFITGNHFHDFKQPDATGEAMYLGANDGKAVMSYSVIAGNHVHDCGGTQGDGIELKQGSHHNWIVGNEVHDTRYPCIIAYGTAGRGINVIERNVCYRSGDNVLQVQGEALVRNNLLVAGDGAGLASTDHQDKTRDLVFVHNTIVTRRRGANLSSWGGRAGMVFANNLVITDGGDAIRFPSGSSGVTLGGNVVVGRVSGASAGFVAGRGLEELRDVSWDGSRRDATPRAGSVVIGAGDPAHAVELDLGGKRRGERTVTGACDAAP